MWSTRRLCLLIFLKFSRRLWLYLIMMCQVATIA
jgi:hypothetical protein